MSRYVRTFAEMSKAFGDEIAKRDLTGALGPGRLGTTAGTAQSRQELQELNHLIGLAKHAFVQHRGTAEREFERLCLDAAPAAAAELSNYFNMRVRLDLEFELSLLECMVDFSVNAITLCDLIDERRDFIQVTPEMILFEEDEDLDNYRRLIKATQDAIAVHKRVATNRKAILAANIARLSK